MIKTRLKYLKFTKPPRSGEKFDLGEKAKKIALTTTTTNNTDFDSEIAEIGLETPLNGGKKRPNTA